MQTGSLGALIGAPDLGPAEEETLLWREAIGVFRAFAFDGFFVGGVSDGQTTSVDCTQRFQRGRIS